ncbi:hypothetical protein KBB17_03375 [Candidatus Saccharibacteria bacterium]|nr:hypothetical protein [Candidatus Saccharibacteria bacterium]MBP9131648.1 hypothetical protein [Candidatus Saccharibacteria bacterium]
METEKPWFAVTLRASIFAFFFAGLLYKAYRKKHQQSDALRNFAASNNMSFVAESLTIDDNQKHGLVFQLGYAKQIVNSASGIFNQFQTWIYQYNFTTGTRKHAVVHEHTVCEVKIGNVLPHVFIDSVQTGHGVSPDVSEVIQKSNRVAISGDFEDYFTLYTQTGLELEVLTIFTPDVFETIKDYLQNFDIEFVGDTIYFYKFGVSTDETDYSNMLEVAGYLVERLKLKLTKFKMPPLPTKPGADLIEARQVTRMTDRQKAFYRSKGAIGLIIFSIIVLLILFAQLIVI